MRRQDAVIISLLTLASCAGAKGQDQKTSPDRDAETDEGQVSTPGGGGPTSPDPNAPPPNNGLPEDEPNRPDYDPLDCPESAPDEGDSCKSDYIFCTYGDSPRFDCRLMLECINGLWRRLERPDDCAAVECPETRPSKDALCDPNGTSFSDKGTPCAYTRALCYCTDCPFGNCQSEYSWECIEQTDKECPDIQPNQGDPCDEQGKDCSYGFHCNGGGQWLCRQGAWFFVPGECDG